MPLDYSTAEASQHSSEVSFYYWFVGKGFEFKWTNAPLAQTIDVAEPPEHKNGTGVRFVHPRGGIAHRDFTASPDAGRTGFEIITSHKNPIILRHRAFPPPGDTDVDIYRQNQPGGELRRIWSGVIIETPIDHDDDGVELGTIKCQHVAEQIIGSDGLTETMGPNCPYRTYHFPCPAIAAAHRTVVTVDDIDPDNFEVTVSGITQIDTWFRNGQAEAPNGDRRMILDHTGGNLILLQNFPALTLRIGDALSLYDGDDLTIQHCRDKFGGETGGGMAFGGNILQAPKNPHEIGRLN